MATKWSYEFFTDTTNAMSIEERIKETVAHIGSEGVVFPDGKLCRTEKELRTLLTEKGVLGDVEKGGWIGKVSTAIVLFVVCALFAACGSKGSETDAAVKEFKVWNYAEVNGMYEARLLSENYVQSEIGENLYLNLVVNHSSDGDGCYIGVHVYGTPDGEIGSVVKFPPSLNNIVVSFDGEEASLWYGFVSNAIFILKQSPQFISRLKASETCTIIAETDYGKMSCDFNTSDLNWN